MGARRRFTALMIVVSAAILGTLFAGCAAHSKASQGASGNVPKCGAGTLLLSLQAEGESGTAVVFAFLLNRSGSTCIASGRASFEIEQSRERAKVQHNPLRIPVHLRLSSGQRRFATPIDWSNWCGSRRHLDVVSHFDGLATHFRFKGKWAYAVPRCDHPESASKLLPTNS